jgi:hypothetical protein
MAPALRKPTFTGPLAFSKFGSPLAVEARREAR